MRALVVYYSWTGNTAKVARAIAEGLGCEIEEIREVRPRKGGWARLRCAIDSQFRRKPAIQPLRRRLEDYDLVILGCPVWARALASPMRTFADQNRGRMRKTAVFCTEAGVGGPLVLETLRRAFDAPAVASLVVTEHELSDAGDWREHVADFVNDIRRAEAADRPQIVARGSMS